MTTEKLERSKLLEENIKKLKEHYNDVDKRLDSLNPILYLGSNTYSQLRLPFNDKALKILIGTYLGDILDQINKIEDEFESI